MSQYRNHSIQPTKATIKNEEFYDMHPCPYDIEYAEIHNNITAYFDPNNPETFLIKIRFQDWQSAEKSERLWSFMLNNTDLDVYRMNKYLFLRRLLF